jgi:hypothetical protein
VKKIACILTAAAAAALFCSCGSNEKNVLNYEQPISALKGALNYSDEASYLSCFLPQAKSKYLASEDCSPDFLDSAIDKNSVISRVRIKITDSTALDENELDELESLAHQNYGTRLDFTKGERLNVNILVDTRQSELCDSRELTVVRYENMWYIYGDVIDSFSFLPLENQK